MGYVIAAYVIVIGSLAAYGLRVQLQRRALIRQDRAARERPGAPGSAGARVTHAGAPPEAPSLLPSRHRDAS